MILRWLRITRRILGHLPGSQRGLVLGDTLVALLLVAMVGTAVFLGVQTSHTSKGLFDVQSTAENIVRNQVEYVFEQSYEPAPGTYLSITPPDGYSVTAEALVYQGEPGTEIETVRVTVFKDGQQVKVLETMRANR